MNIDTYKETAEDGLKKVLKRKKKYLRKKNAPKNEENIPKSGEGDVIKRRKKCNGKELNNKENIPEGSGGASRKIEHQTVDTDCQNETNTSKEPVRIIKLVKERIPVLKSGRFIGFLGMIICLTNIFELY